MFDHDEYEQECARIREENERLLEAFEAWLQEKQLTEKTIRNHVNNVKFYINHFLLFDEAAKAKDGALSIGDFLGYWFIKKALWANVSAIKANAASLKKFYTYMHENGHIDKSTLESLKEIIKDEMPDWLETMERYDDPSITSSEEIWGL